MKTEFEKQALCGSEATRLFLRKKISSRDDLSDDELVLDVFFSDQIPDVRLAKGVCRLCPVKDTCLQDAVKRQETYGVWGGQFFKDGVIDTPKRRGRPPKVKNPEYEVPEVAISPNVQRLIEAQKIKRKAA